MGYDPDRSYEPDIEPACNSCGIWLERRGICPECRTKSFIKAFDEWNMKRHDHIMIASAAWDALERAREQIDDGPSALL